MAARVKTTLSLDEEAVRYLKLAQRRRGIPRSRIVEEALYMARRRELEIELRDGYRSMAGENRKVSEDGLAAGWEVIE